jgi:large subunit ribosomal protein L22
MTGPKTNERPGTRAVLRGCGIPASKVRAVLDLIRGQEIDRADEVLRFSERAAARPVRKLLASAVANAVNNDQLEADELYVSTAYADEGPTAKRWRPRARGRATRIRKRTSHITIIVSRLPEDRLARRRARVQAEAAALRARRVAAARRAQSQEAAPSEEVASEASPAQEVTQPSLAEANEQIATEALVDRVNAAQGLEEGSGEPEAHAREAEGQGGDASAEGPVDEEQGE